MVRAPRNVAFSLNLSPGAAGVVAEADAASTLLVRQCNVVDHGHMDDTWTRRDLPVLDAIVRIHERTGKAMRPTEIEAETRFDTDTVQTALRALDSADPPFVVTKMDRFASGQVSLVGAPTGHARQAVGAWPTAETVADNLVNALSKAAEREQDIEHKSWLTKAAGFLGGTGRDLAIEIGAAAINRQMGV